MTKALRELGHLDSSMNSSTQNQEDEPPRAEKQFNMSMQMMHETKGKKMRSIEVGANTLEDPLPET